LPSLMANSPAADGLPGPDTPPVLDIGFDAGTLRRLRAKVRACAVRAGFAGGHVEEVVLAVHELAANTVRHGGGAGRLRLWNLARALHGQVDDGDLRAAAGPRGEMGQAYLNALPFEPGHGLWVARQVADRIQALSGPAGTSVTIRFDCRSPAESW